MSMESLEAKVEPELVHQWIAKIGSDAQAAVPLLQAIQGQYGYLPRQAMDLVVKHTTINASQLFGVATFYSQFRLKPVGRHMIKVCHGTACHVQGADRLNTSLRHALGITDAKGDTAPNGSYTMEDVACIGCCSLAPVMVVDEQTFGNLKGADAQRSLKKHARDHGEILMGHVEEEAEAKPAKSQNASGKEARS
ncbi:MAG: NAD(P)H-dependent oxidoreductase subunit E [Magnetococcales bacterium]|nr:NAD(P)H-dependent oxidoreductase subunit E [Magnetococcales bacterium]NGZ28216.1 NAD(P)H-dependent oxidoreductase subunit E [Magnetococcales bacterium]